MLKKQSLTTAKLKSLLLARFSMEQSRHARLSARLKQELGNELREEKPGVVALKNKLADWISDVLARRLQQSGRTTSLLSSRDFAKFASLMVNEIEKDEGDELAGEERKTLEKFMRAVFENVFEMVHAMVPPRENLYEEYWRWVTTVLDLAAERGILTSEFLALGIATDEITRRMFTKKQFVALSKRAVRKSMDSEVLKRTILQPMLDMVAEGNEEVRLGLEQELEAEIMPQLRETVEKSKVVFNAWLGEEAERIYAAV